MSKKNPYNKFEIIFSAGLGEFRVFRKKPVTRIDGVTAHFNGNVENRGNREIALGARRRAEADRTVGSPDMGGICVRAGKNRDRFQTDRTACADRPERDFPAVGDKDARYTRSGRDVGHAVAPMVLVNNGVSPYKTIDFIF